MALYAPDRFETSQTRASNASRMAGFVLCCSFSMSVGRKRPSEAKRRSKGRYNGLYKTSSKGMYKFLIYNRNQEMFLDMSH